MMNKEIQWRQVIASVFAALIGIQKEKNRERDFHQTSPTPYIICGILMMVLLILMLLGGVNIMVYMAAHR